MEEHHFEPGEDNLESLIDSPDLSGRDLVEYLDNAIVYGWNRIAKFTELAGYIHLTQEELTELNRLAIEGQEAYKNTPSIQLQFMWLSSYVTERLLKIDDADQPD